MIILRPCTDCGIACPWYHWGCGPRCDTCDAQQTYRLIQKYPHLADTFTASHESHKEQQREMQERYRSTQPRSRPPTMSGVYIVQLLERSNCVKVGCSADIDKRLKNVQMRYGTLHVLMTIPHAQPQTLERELHAHLAQYRLYEKASTSELFQFPTMRAQHYFERLCQKYDAVVRKVPRWARKTTASITKEERQLPLLEEEC